MSEAHHYVFLNVPFDARYRKLLHALVFAVHECGLVARCASEREDSAEVRVEKLYAMIRDSLFGIHDLSRTTLDREHRLPRFNMPFELGLFLGARRYGDLGQRQKSCLILDRDRYRFQIFCSDISGQDIRAHGNEVERALTAVRNWLQANPPSSHRLPSPPMLRDRYLEFRRQLPLMCRTAKLRQSELTFLDYQQLVVAWLEVNRT